MSSSSEAFPAVDAQRELNPANNDNFHVDSSSSNIPTVTKENKPKEQRDSNKAKGKQDAVENVKRTIIISGIVAAVIGAIVAISKKLRETR